jgi:DnaJ family protein C protein 19
MGKLILLAIIGCFVCRHWTGQWPWQMWARMSGPSRTQRARSLLGVSFTADRAEIIAAHKRLIAQVHPDRGGDARLVHEANEARDLLLAQLPAAR